MSEVRYRGIERWVGWWYPVLFTLVISVSIWAVWHREAMGKSAKDTLAFAIAAILLAIGLPRLLPKDLTFRWKKIPELGLDWLHKTAFGRPFAFSSIFLCLWLISHGLFSGCLADPNYGFDLRYFIQAAHNWNDPRGPQWLTFDGPGHSFLAHHGEAFLFLMRPLAQLPLPGLWFAVCQDFAQWGFLVVSILTIRHGIAAPGARCLCLILLLVNPFWSGLIHYEFHEYGFAPLVILGLYWAHERTSFLGWTLACIALLSLKETLFITFAWTGLVMVTLGLLSHRRHTCIMGAIAASLAIGCYFLYFKIILPSVTGSSWTMFAGYFSHLGSGPMEVVLSPILRPQAFWSSVIAPNSLQWIGIWIAVTGGLILLGWRWMLLVLPDIAMLWLSSGDNCRSPSFHYGAIMLPMALLAMISGLRTLQGDLPCWLRSRLPVIGTITVVTAALMIRTPMVHRTILLCGSNGLPTIPLLWDLPPNVPMSATTHNGCMQICGRSVVSNQARFGSENQSEPGIIPGIEWYLLYDYVPFKGRELLREVRRQGDWSIMRIIERPQATQPEP